MVESTVYVVQEPPVVFNRVTGKYTNKDLSSANRYGKIVPILSAGEQASLTPGPSLRLLQRGLKDFKPHDYICFPGGDPVGLALALLVLRDFGFKEVNVLRWDRERKTDGTRTSGGYYTPVLTPLRP